jgi:hypothetical protein
MKLQYHTESIHLLPVCSKLNNSGGGGIATRIIAA